MRREIAFTLTEMLIVIAILLMVAAIAFPVFASVRENSRRSSCSSNLRQIWLSVEMYKADYDGAYPFAVDGMEKSHPTTEVGEPDPRLQLASPIQDALQPYCKSHELFRCPDDYGFPDGNTLIQNAYESLGSSYKFVPLVYAETDRCWEDLPNLVYAKDMSGAWHTTPHAGYFDGQLNALYLDGHVKFGYEYSQELARGVIWGGCHGKQ